MSSTNKLDAAGIEQPLRQASKTRPLDRTADSLSFATTLDSMRQNIELALANRFVSHSMGADTIGGGLIPGGGLAMDRLSMNMLTTLARLTGEPGAYSSRPAPAAVFRRAGLPAPTQRPQENPAAESSGKTTEEPSVTGAIARHFESGPDGAAAIGYDRTGGTSYGSWQISSRQGTMDDFLAFLDDHAPEVASRLRQAGPADTGSTDGGMPDEWRALAGEMPVLFESLQQQFIGNSHFKPAMRAIAEITGIREEDLPQALREVLFSTSVQHGATGAANIFVRALEGLGDNPDLAGLAHKVVERVYDIRADQFGSSTSRVRAAVQSRLVREKDIALAMLQGTDFSSLA